ncbi:selenium-dependent molybdenum cofactor biosynthesis protein YqeB [uncultured Sphaerochaeta sp.]|uniref:selenium-dependent molybdenum cofactor biosynthesis protein YqeB n=1 Tax=uncultured Sphaerochaeta sp. TaxID=886478 RepID=UPI002A0A137B|nr:selenium-dependent molybdenum cofactor biosynthesis protein YqeB [uncultured Sphaerochaeta sp.]
MSSSVFSKANALQQEQKPFALVTIVGKEGSASRENGRMVVRSDTHFWGTIGGGEMEAFALEKAVSLFREDKESWIGTFEIKQVNGQIAGKINLCIEHIKDNADTELFALAAEKEAFHSPFAYIMTLDGTERKRYLVDKEGTLYGKPSSLLESLAKDTLQTGKGKQLRIEDTTYFVDVPQGCTTLLLIGGGHVNQAIASLADTLQIEVQVLETRMEFARQELFPKAGNIVCTPTIMEALQATTITDNTFVVVAAHAFGDKEASYLLSTEARYIGILASSNKERALRSHLSLQTKDEKRLFSPIGLDLGSESPEEIAVSVLAEIMKVRSGTSGSSLKYQNRSLVIVRGAGDLATGVIIRLVNAGYKVLALETDKPTVIRCTVSLAQAMFDKTTTVENITAVRCENMDKVFSIIKEGKVPILADPEGEAIRQLRPLCVVDAILAKKNLGTTMQDAPLVIALGPGFTAGEDCHVVIETKRGHTLGSIITEGKAIADSGIPGIIGGFGAERVIRSPQAGIFHSDRKLGDIVQKGDCIAQVDDQPILATIDGMLRGLLNKGLPVTKGFKVADIDPRGKEAQFTTCSDKAKAIAGGVLEALDHFKNGL